MSWQPKIGERVFFVYGEKYFTITHIEDISYNGMEYRLYHSTDDTHPAWTHYIQGTDLGTEYVPATEEEIFKAKLSL